MPKDTKSTSTAIAKQHSAKVDPLNLGQAKLALRRNQACHQCRRRKMKCDARKPTCTTCARSHLHAKLHPQPGVVTPDMPECTYDELPEPEDDPRVKVEALEKRIHELEGIINGALLFDTSQLSVAELGMEPSMFVEPSKDPAVVRLDIPIVVPTAPSQTYGDYDATQISSFLDIGIPSSGSSSSISSSPPSTEQSDLSLSQDRHWDGYPSELPRIEVVRKYVDIFFTYHYHATRLFHQDRFVRSLYLHPTDANFPSTALLHSICGLGSLMGVFGDNPDGIKDRVHLKQVAFEADRHFNLAKRKADDDMAQGVRLFQAQQALLLCAYWAWCNARWMEVYSISARILRNCLPLGLHASDAFKPISDSPIPSILPPPIDAAEAEERRNVFWLAYAFERQSGCGHAWPLSLDDLDVSQLLPVTFETFTLGFSWPPDEHRQHPFTPNVLLTHNLQQTDPFILWIKGTMVLSRVKSYNMRYRQRRAIGDAAVELPTDYEKYPWAKNLSQCPSMVREGEDPRKTVEFFELDSIAGQFEDALSIKVPSPLKTEDVDAYLYAASLMGHVALIMLHDPHASIESMACLSTRRLLSASRAILRLATLMLNTHYTFAMLNQFSFFAWFMAGKTLTRFWELSLRMNSQDQASIFRAEVEQLGAALNRAGNYIPLPRRYLSMLQENIARECGEKLNLPVQRTIAPSETPLPASLGELPPFDFSTISDISV